MILWEYQPKDDTLELYYRPGNGKSFIMGVLVGNGIENKKYRFSSYQKSILDTTFVLPDDSNIDDAKMMAEIHVRDQLSNKNNIYPEATKAFIDHCKQYNV